MAFNLPDLPYDYDALEPHMSAETLHLHHGKHHKGYVGKLNEAVEEAGVNGLSLEELIQRSADKEDERELFNNAAQSWNHEFFWNCMTPNGGGEPEGELARQIKSDFGSFEKFREEFKAAATGRFGSGWAWLVLDNGRLKVMSTANAELPMTHGRQALLTCDVWEHAYYLDYNNERDRFVDAFLDNLVNWKFVAERFALQGEGSPVAGRRYQEAQEDYASSGSVKEGAESAAEALDGAEAEDLEKARRSTGSVRPTGR